MEQPLPKIKGKSFKSKCSFETLNNSTAAKQKTWKIQLWIFQTVGHNQNEIILSSITSRRTVLCCLQETNGFVSGV